MSGRTFTVQLTDTDAEILEKVAAAEGKTPEDLIVDLTRHELRAILYGLGAHDRSKPICLENVLRELKKDGADLPF